MHEIKVGGAGGEYMDAVVVVEWHRKVGDPVQTGDVVVTVETAKAASEIEAPASGTISAILMDVGAEVPIGGVLGLIGDGFDGSTTVAPFKIEQQSATRPIDRSQNNAVNGGLGGRIVASPLARREAGRLGIDLSNVTGSGPRGRIVRADVAAVADAAHTRPKVAPQLDTVLAPTTGGQGAKERADLLQLPHRIEPLSRMRQTIAGRLSEAKRTVPHFYLTVECEMDELLKLKAQLQAHVTDAKLSINDFIIKAAASALKKVPAVNVSYDVGGLVHYETIDVSVAVTTPGGLVTPIVKNAETRGIADISASMRDLASRARGGKLRTDEYQGGTFSISNLGMFGVRQFDAIVNLPQACILAVGKCEQRPVVRNEAIGIATLMNVTLSVDHRAVDGAAGAEWLEAFKSFVENPLTLML
jgi:pyruvate dehydrogenase E2 component (dihydrolipoamide acetyltransferase)